MNTLERQLQYRVRDFFQSQGYLAIVDEYLDFYDIIAVNCPIEVVHKRLKISGTHQFKWNKITDVQLYKGIKEGLGIEDLCNKYNVTRSTILRHINYLEKINLLRKTGRGRNIRIEVINPMITFEEYETIFVEVKRSNFKRAIEQCIDRKPHCNKIYLAVPEKDVEKILSLNDTELELELHTVRIPYYKYASPFKRKYQHVIDEEDIGIISIGKVAKIEREPKYKKKRTGKHFTWIMERIFWPHLLMQYGLVR